MSGSPPEAAPRAKYEAIFNAALKSYKKKAGKDLKSDSLLRTLEACTSPNETLSELQRQIPGFDQSENSDNRLTNWVNPVVDVLYLFAQTIGGGVGLAFNPAAVIFTGISSLLSVVIAVRGVQSSITDLFESIKKFFLRLRIYVELPHTEELTEIIVDVMVHVLHILALLTKEIKGGKIRTFLRKLIGRSDIEDASRSFEKLTQEESRMVTVQNLKAAHGVGNDVRDATNKIDAVLDGGENMRVELQQVARGVSDLAKDASDEKRNQMREDIETWLSPADPFINLNTANDAHYEGTAEWFTHSSAFESWKESGSLLWIHGKPGSGKSVLSSTIIQNINGICNNGTGLVAFFFFDFKDTGKQDARALLSSIIVQLSADRSVDFFDVLHNFYSSHRDGKHQPSISALSQCLEDMFKVPGELPIYLIIDAIDECPNTSGLPPSRVQVLALVEKYVALKLPNLHICVTSRPEADIRTSLEPLASTSNTISLHDESGQRNDIVEFVTSVVRTDQNMRRWREEDRELVINTLSERAEGMFRWAFCQLEALRHCLPPSVRGTLAELPETLDATYERILQEIPKTNQVHAHRLLQCLTVAFRPLVVEELAEVLAMDFDVAGGIPKLNEEFRWPDQEQAVLSACSSLIAIVKHRNSRRVQFSHFSVKEFLTSDRLATSELNALRYHHIQLEPAHDIMAQACLGVLFRLDDSMDKETIRSYPMAGYAVEFVDHHTEAGSASSQIIDGVDYLLDPDKPHYKILLWLDAGDAVAGSYPLYDFNMDPSSDSNESSSEQPSTDQPSSEHPFPKYTSSIPFILYATARGDALLKHLILKHAHDLDASDTYGKTALHAAAFASRFEAVRMLIEHSADINARDNKGCTPLHYAVVAGMAEPQDDHLGCVRLLLERGADADAQNDRGTTPLHLAASGEDIDEEIVQILVENVTNINLRNAQGQTALHKAVRHRDADIVGIILSHGVDVDAQDNSGTTPLHLAISKWDLLAPEQLLKHGARIDLKNKEGQTALHLALQRRKLSFMRLLLENGANVDALDKDGSTPLHQAIFDQDSWLTEPAVELLVKHGANVNLRNGQGQTALHKASLHGYLNIVPLILNHGADVDAQDNDGSTPLHLVISKVPMRSEVSHDSKILVEFEVPESPKPSEDSEASVDSDLLHEVIKLLLEHGASVHRENNRGETPFQVAGVRGLQEITRLMSMHIQSEQVA